MDNKYSDSKPRYLWGLLLLGLIGYTSDYDNSPSVDIQVEEVWRIGGETTASESETEEFSFGRIFDIEADKDGNLYVLDYSLWQITKYSPGGDVIRTIHLRRGEGPGEVVDPMNIVVDSEGKIFMTSWEGYYFTVFGAAGTAEGRFHIPFEPASITTSKDLIFISSFWGSTDSVLHVYNLEGTEIQTMLSRPDDWMAMMAIGAQGDLASSFDDRLYYSSPSPYQIVEFGHDGGLIRESTGQPEFEPRDSGRRPGGLPIRFSRR